MTAEPDLYWSLRGEVACGAHAPDIESPRWQEERWQRVPAFVFTDLRKRLQCQHCEETSGRPYRHDRREASPGADSRADVAHDAAHEAAHDAAHDEAAVREHALLVAQMENLRRDYDALLRRFSSNPDLSTLLRRVREHLDALSSLMETVRNRSPGKSGRH